jgi:acyl dehydratase
LELTQAFRHVFRYTQDDVIKFSEVSGDTNPLHLDADYAAQTPFRRPIIHGMLALSVFSKILGTQYPGPGSVYLNQRVEFLRPMYVDTDYEAVFSVISTNPDKHTAEISTEIFDAQTRKICVRGVAGVLNKSAF